MVDAAHGCSRLLFGLCVLSMHGGYCMPVMSDAGLWLLCPCWSSPLLHPRVLPWPLLCHLNTWTTARSTYSPQCSQTPGYPVTLRPTETLCSDSSPQEPQQPTSLWLPSSSLNSEPQSSIHSATQGRHLSGQLYPSSLFSPLKFCSSAFF